tara:strand:- start:304 stop:729 length:426 start_codon:yes stop_codon:yes gene_type:complete
MIVVMDTIFNIEIMHIIQLLIAIFLAICLLQSGADKIIDFQGNKEYFSEHFANSPLHKFDSLLLVSLTILELSGGLLAIIGIMQFIFSHTTDILRYAFVLQACVFICLFAGQRLAKDYTGAAILVNYFLLTILALLTYVIG